MCIRYRPTPSSLPFRWRRSRRPRLRRRRRDRLASLNRRMSWRHAYRSEETATSQRAGSSRVPDRSLRTEDEVDRTHQAQAGPEEIQFYRLLHVEYRERHKNTERNHLLKDLQFRQIKCGIADPIRWHLEAVLDESDRPTGEDRDHQR